MKTVSEIIREAGITRQSLYNAMKRAGTNVNALASEKQGNTMLFDKEAEERVKSIIEKYCQKTVNVKDQLSKAETKLRKQEEDIKRLQAEAEELRRELKEKRRLEEDTKRLQTELEGLREEHKMLTAAAATNAVTIQRQHDQIERLQQHITERITDGAAAAPSAGSAEGWIQRTWRRITGKGVSK